MPKWSDIRALNFLDMYERHECLWNPRIEEYKNKSARNTAYESMLRELQLPDITINDIKLKIKSVRTTYKRELTQVLKAEATRVKGAPEYKPKLFWFHRADGFLRPVSLNRFSAACPKAKNRPDASENQSMEHESSEVNYRSANHNKYKQETLHEMTMALEETDTEEMQNVSEEHNVETLEETNIPPPPKLESRPQQDISAGETTREETITIAAYQPSDAYETTSIQENDTTTTSHRETHEDDEYTMFCRSVEAQLRSIPDSYSRSLAKFKIQQVLFEAETGHYRKATYVTMPNTHP